MHRLIKCKCGATHAPEAFALLEPVRVLDDGELAPIVVRWPANTVVEVRSCSKCSTPIARLRRG